MYQVILLTGADPGSQWAGLSAKYTSTKASIPPLGAYSCANALRDNNISCLVINHTIQYSIDEINTLLDSAITDNTVMIGFSVTFWLQQRKSVPHGITDRYAYWEGQFDSKVIDRIKTKYPHIKFIAGGVGVDPNKEYAGLDFMSLGYSETSIVNIANCLIHGTEIPKSYKNIFGTIVVDDRTAESYDFTNKHIAWMPEDVVNHTKLPIGIGRGCIFNCSFCSFPFRGKNNLDYVRTTESIITELTHNYNNYGISKYIIIDDTFNDSKEKLEHTRDAIKLLNFQPTFWCYARLDLLAAKPETIDLLYEIGIRAMYFGIESLNRKTALAFGKGMASDKLIDTINNIKAKYPDIMLHGNFIIGGPHESIDSVTHTAELLRDGHIHLDSWKFNALYIHPNPKSLWPSEFDLNWQKYGYRAKTSDRDTLNWENDFMDFSKALELSKLFGSDQYRKSKWGNYYQMTEWYVEDAESDVFLPKYKESLLEIVRRHR